MDDDSKYLTEVFFVEKDDGDGSDPSVSGYNVSGYAANPMEVTATNSALTLKYAKIVDDDNNNRAFGNSATLTTVAQIVDRDGNWKTVGENTQTITPKDDGSGVDCIIADASGINIPLVLTSGEYRIIIEISNSTIGTLTVYDNVLDVPTV